MKRLLVIATAIVAALAALVFVAEVIAEHDRPAWGPYFEGDDGLPPYDPATSAAWS